MELAACSLGVSLALHPACAPGLDCFRTTGDTDLEKVLITPVSHSLGCSQGPSGVPRPSDSTSMVPLALPGSEGLFFFPETPSPTLLKDVSAHTKSVPSLLRDCTSQWLEAQALELHTPGSESQNTRRNTCPTRVYLKAVGKVK